MRTLYIDCGMGAAGDMLTASLLELLPDPSSFVDRLNSLGLENIRFIPVPSVKCGITGTHMSVVVNGEEEESLDYHYHTHIDDAVHSHNHEHIHEHEHEHIHNHDHSEEHTHSDHHDHDSTEDHAHSHHHSSLHDITHLVKDHLNVSDNVKKDVLAVYALIAEAESHVHGTPVEQIHFHEVGSLDAVADITAVCMLMEELSPDQIVVSPIHVGSGKVRCAHGILPVPAPATAYILKDVPIYSGNIRGELCTPTGAALLKHFATSFGEMPVMRPKSIGYGMGNKDFEVANCVRSIIGETDDTSDSVYELSCNLDDMTGEKIAFAMERIFEAGAVDVYTIPIGMKKSRPGILIRAMCHKADKEAVIAAIFRHTTTLGIRETKIGRYVLNRKVETENTDFGPVRKKTASGYGVKRSKWEYEDLASVSLRTGMSIAEIEEKLS